MRIAIALIAVTATTLAACSRHGNGERGGWEPTTQTRAECTASLDQRFGRMDRNNDGAIQPDELRGRRGGGGGDGANASEAAGGGGGRRAGRMMRMDTDHDGEISRSEFTAGSLSQFDRADANHDGTVTVEEWQVQRDQRRSGEGGDATENATAAVPSGNAAQ